MGFIKEIKSKKDVTMKYWQLKTFSFNESGTLTMRVSGYKGGKSYASGAEAIDDFECIIENADPSLKTPFYNLLEQCFPLFMGSKKELTYSGYVSGPQTLTIQTPRGDLIARQILGADNDLTNKTPSPEYTDIPEEPMTGIDSGLEQTELALEESVFNEAFTDNIDTIFHDEDTY